MSDEDIRRVRRVIEGAPPPTAARPALETRQAERFQRALVSPRRFEPEPRGEIRGDLVAGGEEPQSEGAADASPRIDERRPPPPVQAATAVVAASDEPETATTPAVDAPHIPWPPAIAWLPLPQGWDAALVDTVATLCRRADPSFVGFSVTVPMNLETLPHTELRLTLSPHYLQLRFQTQSTRSHDLVLRHLGPLRAMLAQALPDSRHIDIELT
jgi:type III secretion control protein HpaP